MENNMQYGNIPNPIENNGKKKHRMGFLPGFIIGIVATLLILSICGVFILHGYITGNLNLPGSMMTTEVDPSTIPNNSEELNLSKINSKMKLLQSIIGRYYLFDENMEDVQDGIYSGLMSGLGDPYSVYYNEEDYNALTEETMGVYCGIGAMVSQNATTGIVTAIRVFENSPAAEAGMMSGDILYKVGDQEVTGMDLDLLVGTYIRGEEGTTVDITVVRGDTGKEIDLNITRRSIEVPTVEHQMLDNNIGYISVSQFDDPTTSQFKKAIEDLQSQGAESLIIDLRDNPGGLLNTAVDMLDYVLPDGLLVYTADKQGNGEKYYSDDGHQIDLPIALLVNGNSASASEVFSGAMRDFGRAQIVGTQTFGKGIVQNVIPLGDGTAIKITVQHYYTPSGFDLHGKGIEPDKIVELQEDAVYLTDTDNQLEEAKKLLSK